MLGGPGFSGFSVLVKCGPELKSLGFVVIPVESQRC